MTQMIYQNGEARWNETGNRKNRRTQRKTRIIATLSTTTPTWNDEGANLGLRGERSATNRLIHSTAWIKVTGTNEGIRVLDVSGHLKSRALKSQSASVPRSTFSLSLCAASADTNDRLGRWRPCFSTVLRIYCLVPSSASQLQSLALRSLSLSLSLRGIRRHKWPSLTMTAVFWTVLRIYCHVPSWASQLQSLALRSLSLSARHPPTQMTVLDDDGRVLDGSAHLLSRALVSQSASVPCCTLSVCTPSPFVRAGHFRHYRRCYH
jgi:hypothetical protein